MILVELLPGPHSSPTRSKQARRLLPNRLTCAVIAVGRQPNLLNTVILLSIIGRLVADRYTAEVVRGWHGKRGHLTCPHPWDSGQPYSPLPRLSVQIKRLCRSQVSCPPAAGPKHLVSPATAKAKAIPGKTTIRTESGRVPFSVPLSSGCGDLTASQNIAGARCAGDPRRGMILAA